MCRRTLAGPMVLVLALVVASCAKEEASQIPAASTLSRPTILLVTLDTTRADRLGFETDAVRTPVLDALAARGVRFTSAWTTAPMTLPSHTSMLTGLYPSQHGIHENSRFLDDDHTLLQERLRHAGYTTAAFISGYPLKRRFGLARGFDHYDDQLGEGNSERKAADTTDRVVEFLESSAQAPLFLWVHYFDPHDPYAPPEPFLSQYPSDPYLGEIAYMDHELGRLLAAFAACFGEGARILVVGDHGEGLGDHGELLHGNLLYSCVTRVPLIAAGDGIAAGVVDTPVSTRRVFDTVLDWAGLDSDYDFLDARPEIVMGEALKPFLQYGWQPQVMAVSGDTLVIRSGVTEVFNVRSDPDETLDLSGEMPIDPQISQAIDSYALPDASGAGPSADILDEETKKQLASLGYSTWEGSAPHREDAPNPKDMTYLFADLDLGSALFAKDQYRAAIEVFENVLQQDPQNLMVTVRLAVAYSLLGNERRATALFARAEQIHPASIDVKNYLAMHYFRFHHFDLAAPLLEEVLVAMPRKLPALEALARIRENQGQLEEAARLVQRTIVLKESPAPEYVRLGDLEMAMGDTPAAIGAFEEARDLEGPAFNRNLELGVLYLAAGRLDEAAAALDLVPPSDPVYPMALFKRAQVGALRNEPGWQDRVRLAYQTADPQIRRLIESENLFRGVPLP